MVNKFGFKIVNCDKSLEVVEIAIAFDMDCIWGFYIIW